MKTVQRLTVLGILALFIVLTSFVVNADSKGGDYKCLIQLKNYQGEGAYVVVSLINSKGEYESTLRVLGDDHEWYPDMKAWYKSRENKRHQPRLDGVTGASIGSGERSVVSFKIEEQYIDKGYSLRFETAVEDKMYHKNDLSVELTSGNLKAGKFAGTEGYIRMVRLIPVSK